MIDPFIYTPPLRRYYSTPSWQLNEMEKQNVDFPQYDYIINQAQHSLDQAEACKPIGSIDQTSPSDELSSSMLVMRNLEFEILPREARESNIDKDIPNLRNSQVNDGNLYFKNRIEAHTTPLKRFLEDSEHNFHQPKRKTHEHVNRNTGVNPYYTYPWKSVGPENCSQNLMNPRIIPTTPNQRMSSYGINGLTSLHAGLATPMTHSYSEDISRLHSPLLLVSDNLQNSCENDSCASPNPILDSKFSNSSNLTSDDRQEERRKIHSSTYTTHSTISNYDDLQQYFDTNYDFQHPINSQYSTPIKAKNAQVPFSIGVFDIDKPFTCEICDRRFKRQEHLRRHEKTHTNEKQFLCSIANCGKAFSRADNMRAHEKIHFRKNKRKFAVKRDASSENAGQPLEESKFSYEKIFLEKSFFMGEQLPKHN